MSLAQPSMHPVVWFEVDDRALVWLGQQTTSALDRLIDDITEDLRQTAAEESASRHITWTAEPGRVVADQWFAHFLARGTAPHGPESARRLFFSIDGQMVSPAFVAGIPADPFHERAAEAESSRIDDILRRAIGEVT